MSNIIDLNLSELALNIKNKKISSTEATSAYIERSKNLDVACGAFRPDAAAGSNYPKRRSSEEDRWSFSFFGGYAGELKKGYGDSSNKNNDQSFYNRNIF